IGVLAVVGVALVAAIALALLMRRPLSAGNLDANVIVVSPFRVSGADPSVAYLREGMLDLLGAKLTGEGGPRAMDPRTVLSAWRREGGSDREDVAQESMLRAAAGLGAGQLLLGGVVGSPGRLVISASVLSVPSGAVRAQASVEGPQDSLPSLVDRLTAQLLAIGAGEQGHRLSKLTSTSLPALRAYLDGQAAYRRGRYREAVDHLRIALQHDSTFALAAMSLAAASQWTFEWPLRQRAVELAWRSRTRLSEADLAQLAAQAGRSYPRVESWADNIALADSAVRAAPDRADRWFVLGDVLFHFGATTDVAAPHQRAHAAFERALALDSSFAAPLEHLVELAALANDTAEVRRYSALYLAYHPDADVAEFIRWRAAHFLRDEATLDRMRRSLRDLGEQSLHRIMGIAQLTGLGLDDAELAAREMLRRAGSAAEREQAVTRLAQLLANRGRLREGWQLFSAGGNPDAPELQLGAIVGALMYGADSLLAEHAASRLAAFVDREATSSSGRLERYRALCWLARWRLSKGDTTFAANAAARLPALGAATESAPEGPVPLGQPPLCAMMLEAEIAVAAAGPNARQVVQRVDSVVRTGPNGPDVEAMILVLSQLYDRLGAPEAGLAAARRRVYNWDESALWYLPQLFRQEGKLAALIGDREGAARAFRLYLALHANPDPGLRAAADSVRADLARLDAR
ncbi:MAG TPA: hypothetical protein VJ596_08275, partial [Gemmatimonadaceae bacterium]|nr:hypothetical protein [Gemmatimonadaceae bacterium]